VGTAHDPAFRFASLWADAQPAVAGFVAALVPDRHAVDDLVQEVALAAFEDFASFDGQRPFTSWAIGIARHKVHNRWRSIARGKVAVGDPALIDRLAEVAVELEDDLSEERRALRDCLDGVEGRAWEAVRGHYIDGLDATALAERLRTTAGNIRVLLHRTRSVLRACIERRLAESGHG
jgi:RNA polymerase sigma-70 factor (ECF subfamily)